MPDGPVDAAEAVVWLLFTDIVGSTARWEADPDGMRSALELHDRISTEAVVASGGRVVKHTGDGVFACFSDASDAVTAALEVQTGLRTAPWPEGTERIAVRAGVSGGHVLPHGDDLRGRPVNRAARIAAAAHGGQVLVDLATLTAAAALPPGTVVSELGSHRLPDLGDAVELWQVDPAGQPTDVRAPRSLSAVPHNLPVAPSELLGHHRLLRSVSEALEPSRLVTVVGPGGVGKTRLALQVAADRVHRHRDGVWLVELARASPATVTTEIATTLGVDDEPGRDRLLTIVDHVRGARTLLLLDNAEHVADEVAAVVDGLRLAGPELRVLVTSREPLRVAGERVIDVPPLADTDPVAARELLVERLRTSAPHALDGAPPDLVDEVVARVEGLPLALELAAARCRSLGLRGLLDQLERGVGVLSGGTRTADARQRSLEASVAWSTELLSAEGRQLFAAWGAFAADPSLALVEHVTRAAGLAEDPLEPLTELVDGSLVTAVHDPAESRYRMLETVRAVARRRLDEGPDRGAVLRAHVEAFRELAEEAGKRLEGREQRHWLTVVQHHLPDLRLAVERAVDRGDVISGTRIAAGLYRYWFLRDVRQGIALLRRCAATDGELPPPVRARLHYTLGSLLQVAGEPVEAMTLLESAAKEYRELGNDRGLGYALHYLGRASWGIDPPAKVRARFEEGARRFASVDDPVGLGLTELLLGVWELLEGTLDGAEDLLRRCDERFRAIGAPQLLAHGAEMLAWVHTARGDVQPGRAGYLEAIGHYRKIGNPNCEAHCLENVALLLAPVDPVAATELIAATAASRARIGVPSPAYEDFSATLAMASVAERLSEEQIAAARDVGARLDREAALGRAEHALQALAPEAVRP